MFEWVNPAVALATVFLALFGTVWSFAWWLSGKFSGLGRLVYEETARLEKAILDKLEYHERHDDSRFSEIRGDIMDIRLRNAAIDGVSLRNRELVRRSQVEKENSKDSN